MKYEGVWNSNMPSVIQLILTWEAVLHSVSDLGPQSQITHMHT